MVFVTGLSLPRRWLRTNLRTMTSALPNGWRENAIALTMDPDHVRSLWMRATHVARRPPKGYLTGKSTSFQLRADRGNPPFAVVSVAWGTPSPDAAVVRRIAWNASVATETDAWKAFGQLVGTALTP